MTANKHRAFYEALTRHNYFPNQKTTIGELPPCLSTRRFTPEIAEQIANIPKGQNPDSKARSKGYDLVEYTATRYNNVPRVLSLVHPKAHALLCQHINEHWDKLNHIENNERSIIKPEYYEDGRYVIMGYGCAIEKIDTIHAKSFGKKFRVHTDISNCFNSIYSHSLSWALVGFEEAKRKSGNQFQAEWFNQYDFHQRNTKRAETQGIPIGPTTSNVAVEAILGKIDQQLVDAGFDFQRYIDDYECYCETREEADKFILLLGKELAKYKLTLHLNKTKIVELPHPHEDEWTIELKSALPSRLQHDSDAPKLSSAEALSFLNKAILLNKTTPDGSVLKYAIHIIVNYLQDNAAPSVYSCVLNLAWHYPILIPFLDTLIDKAELAPEIYINNLNTIILENARQSRSDGMCWPLHILRKNNLVPNEEIVAAILDSKDCVAITILNSFIPDNGKIKAFANKIIDTDDLYEKDRYWLLLYQLFLNGDVKNAYNDKKVFEIMKSENVDFLPDESFSKAEKKCDMLKVQEIFGDITELEF